MRYLITGGAGFIGSHLTDAYVRDGHEVTILDDLSTGSDQNIRTHLDGRTARLVTGSVLDSALVRELVAEADAVIHLAATVGVELVVRDPLRAIENNVEGTRTVLSACSEHRTRVLLTSTSEIYGKNTSDRLHEDADRIMGSPSKARWAYATSKVVDEVLAYEHWRQHGTPTVVARLFNCSGPRQTGSYGMVIPRFVRQALQGEDVTVYGDGLQTRCFCHVADTVAGLMGLVAHSEAVGQPYNIGGSGEITMRDLAERVIELAGSSSRIRFLTYEEAYEPGFEDMQRRVPDITRVHELTGWQPTRSLDDIIGDVVAEERQRLQASVLPRA
ncbi:MAG: GDP-mannose 4,6-dehydratase [Actinomycetota bacterium]|nr:GDP-mannose 4,6-dehydratase [Actinomycetota bacterium]